MKRYILILSLLMIGSCKSSEVLFASGGLLNADFGQEKLDIEFKRNLIFVPVEVDGVIYRFLFDSGAPMVVSKELSEKHGLKVLRSSKIRDSQGQVRSQNYVKLPHFKLGNQSFEDFVAVESDLRYSPILSCLDFDGIIGANLMQKLYWELNVADSSLIMSSTKNHWNLNAKTYHLPFKTKATGTPVVQLTINGKKVSGLTFDTGSSGVLSLPKSTYDGLEPDSLVFQSYGYLSGGLFGSTLDSADEHMLPFSFDDDEYFFPVEFEAAKSSGLLGMRFLRNFKIYMDWPAREMLLQAQSEFSTSPTWPLNPFFEKDVLIIGSGTSLLKQQGLNSLEIGDTILSCNGVDYSQANRDDLCRIYDQFIAESDSLSLGVKGKGEFVIYRQKPF